MTNLPSSRRFRRVVQIVVQAIFVVGILDISSGMTDGIIDRLPADGTWVRFDLQLEELNSKGQSNGKLAGSQTVRSVGQVDVDGRTCRWIELEERFRSPNGPDAVQIWKLLVPEKQLVHGVNPVDDVIAAWSQTGQKQAARRIEDLSEVKLPLNPFFFGPPDEVTALGKRVFETKLGKLECNGSSGKHLDVRTKAKGEYSYETWIHHEAAFGVVQHRCELRVLPEGQPEYKKIWLFQIAESGKGAKSAIPDAE